jgi:glycerophosphoryl diester phosphodiesterase
MKPIYVKVVLFDPVTQEEFEVHDDLEVEVARVLSDPAVGHDALQLQHQHGVYTTDSPNYETTRAHRLRVGFRKVNFSKSMGRLLAQEEVTTESLPVCCPSRLPYWDTGWDDNYETNALFGFDEVKFESSSAKPLKLRIPLRRVYNIGHRGAPHFFPENTLASFRQALDLGANGIELDLCLTKDNQIAVFHDPEPVRHPANIDRTSFEMLPFDLVSPEFSSDGREAFIKRLSNGEYQTSEVRPMRSSDEFDIVQLTLSQIREYYRYRHVQGVEYGIPLLEDLLSLAASEPMRLELLVLDVKNPDWDDDKDKDRFLQYGTLLGERLRRFPGLSQRLIVANDNERVLASLRDGIRRTGEARCEFVYDAPGSFWSLFHLGKNPLKVSRRMGNAVVSVGSLGRPGSLAEIREAVRDRDYNRKSSVTTVIHWTLNEGEQMHESLGAGVNGIITDKPDEFMRVLARQKLVIRPDS